MTRPELGCVDIGGARLQPCLAGLPSFARTSIPCELRRARHSLGGGGKACATELTRVSSGLRSWRRLVSVPTVLLIVAWGATAGAQDRNVEPVTDAMLQDPDPADWLSWRRTLDGWGYSPLDQIDTENVHQLQLVWS